jgi:hypothetical protein
MRVRAAGSSSAPDPIAPLAVRSREAAPSLRRPVRLDPRGAAEARVMGGECRAGRDVAPAHVSHLRREGRRDGAPGSLEPHLEVFDRDVRRRQRGGGRGALPAALAVLQQGI